MTTEIRKLQNCAIFGSLVAGVVLLLLEFFLNAHPISLVILTVMLCLFGPVSVFLQRHVGRHIGAKKSK